MENALEKDIDSLILENARRRAEIFCDYDPITGKSCYGFADRIRVQIPDLTFTDMYVPKECFENRVFNDVVRAGSVKRYITDVWGKPYSKQLHNAVCAEVLRARMREDPEFALYTTDQIVDKMSGKMIPFKLNYPQRKLISLYEKLRHEGKPILVIILKARQWGGSTLTQLYIKWMHDFRHPDGWNAVILAQVKDTASKIKAMYRKATESQASWTLGIAGAKLKFAPYENSRNDFIVTDGTNPVRSSTLSIASFENFDNVRGDNFHCAHYSEVAYWKDSPEHDPESVISAISSGIPFAPDNIEVFESTGKGTAGFFYDKCQDAMSQGSNDAYSFIFIPFFFIENDMLEVENQREFARWLLVNKDSSLCPAGYRETGKFFWKIWREGATFEAINWYRITRNRHRSHAYMASEAPVDTNEAFRNSGRLVFDPYALDEMKQKFCREPVLRMRIHVPTNVKKGKEMYKGAHFTESRDGELKVWQKPNNNVLRINNRYLVSVDIGGKGIASDYTVMTVIDRKGIMPYIHGIPQVVARWRGHVRHDRLAWMAAALAYYYDNALLVIESNTSDRSRESNTEGDHFGTIIEEIADYYDNLYQRTSGPEAVQDKVEMKWGFHANVLTKGWIIDNMTACVDEALWDEPDYDAYNELRIYERRDDNSLGNIKGKNNHDDIVMSTAIGLWVSYNDMPKPTWKTNGSRQRDRHDITEASF